MMEIGNAEPSLVTTLVPTFNRASLLRRAMASVLEQSGPALRVCVFDNASDDETQALVSRIAAQDRRVVYHRHSHNIGAAANFDFAMRSVITPYFSILSDDDYLLPGAYERALGALGRFPEALCWAGLTLNVDEQGRVWDARVRHWPREGVYSPPEGFMQMTGGLAPTWTGMVFRREVLDQVGFLDSSMHGPSDLEYCLRLAARNPFVLEKYPAAVFTLNSSSFSATQPMSSFWPGWKNMLEKFAADESLSEGFRRIAVAALQRDAERMLFRRGVNGLAGMRLDFAREAALALERDCGRPFKAALLRVLAAMCGSSPLIQDACTRVYRRLERRIVDSRASLQSMYGHLLRPD